MAVNRTYKPLLDQLGITYPQYLVLLALWEEDGRIVGGLAARGSALREECGCLAEALIARSGMAGKRLAALNKDVQALCEALFERRS
jgi:hypothetical protein